MYIARSIPIRIHSDKTATPAESRSLGSGGGKCICYRRIVSSSAVKRKKKQESQKRHALHRRFLHAPSPSMSIQSRSFPQFVSATSISTPLLSAISTRSYSLIPEGPLSSSKFELVLPLSNPQCRRPRWYRARWEEGIRVVAFPACAAASFRLMSARYLD